MKKVIIIFLVLLNSVHGLSGQRSTADSLREAIKNADENEKAALLISLANQYQYSDIDLYRKYSEEARGQAARTGDSVLLSKAIMQIGYYFLDKGEYKKSLDQFLQSLRMSEKTGDKKGMANSLFSLGNVYYYLNDVRSSLENYQKSLKIYEELGETRGRGLVSNTIGVIHMDQREFEKALEFFNQAIRFYKTINDKASVGQVLTNMSFVYTEMKNYDNALGSAFLGLDIAKEMNDRLGTAKAYISIAGIYNYQRNYERAQEHYDTALTIAFGEKDKGTIRQIYLELYTMYKNKPDLVKALGYLELENKYKDSLFTIESQSQITEMRTRYNAEKNEQAIVMLKKDKQREEIIRNSVISILVLVLFLGFYVYRGYKAKKKANLTLMAKNIIIEEKNKSISDSIQYAKRIQQSILPSDAQVKALFPDSFVLYRPKDVVSGDFYTIAQKNGKAIIAAVDCTGHGVPGAFMSVMGNDQLTHIILEQGIIEPSEVLNLLNRRIRSILRQDETNSQSRDGMDVALCTFDSTMEFLEFAGANRPLYHVRDGVLTEIRPDKMPVGGSGRDDHSFKSHRVELRRDDVIYICSDGYADQFGGPDGKKFMTRSLKSVLEKNSWKSMHEQEILLNDTLDQWKGQIEQVDDILVVGVRV